MTYPEYIDSNFHTGDLLREEMCPFPAINTQDTKLIHKL